MNQIVPAATAPKPDQKIEYSLAKVVDFLKEYEPPIFKPAKDILDGKYKVDLNSPLPQFDTPNARGYAATDLVEGKNFLALVCEPNSMPRHQVIQQMLLVRQANLSSVVAFGVIELSQPVEERFVVFMEPIKGQKLSTVFANAKGRISTHLIMTRIIAPVVQAILALQEAGITHGSINLDNVYYDTQTVVGPCVTAPCGYHQPYYYELVERMQAHPAGKGEFHPGADFYALAVMILQLIHGGAMLERNPPDIMARAILRMGPFMALTGGREVPEEFFDFFWGMLGSGTSTRWNYRYLKPWLEGKHYNIIASPPPADSQKPYECFGTVSFSRREIAHLIRQNWNKTQESLSLVSLPQWISAAMRNKEMVENIGRHTRIIIESAPKNDQQRNETIMRLLMQLDLIGPMQYVNVAFHPDSIPALFADIYFKKTPDMIPNLLKFMEQNFVRVWIDEQQIREIEISEEFLLFSNKLDRMRNTIRMQGFGFGVERILYDLNPDMPCLSPLCRGRHITTPLALLKHLDTIAPSMAATQDPIDVHIAAFIASKLNITNEVKLYDLAVIPALANHPSLIALKLFSIAQLRSGNLEFSGLTHWIAGRIIPAMQNLRSHTIRERTLRMLMNEALEGRTQRLADLLLDGEIVNTDQGGFQKALTGYRRNEARIERYRTGATLDHDSSQLGHIIAKIFAYLSLIVSVYNMYTAYQQ